MTIVSEFDRIVRMFSNFPAVRFEDEVLSYKELDDYSNYISNYLASENIDEDVIGVFINRSIPLIATILGVLKLGKAYMPIDTSYPEDRIKDMVNTAGVSHIVLLEGETYSYNFENKHVIKIPRKYQYKTSHIDRELFNSNKMACVLFTSGSTGVPYGVKLSHSSILNTVKWAINYYALSCKDVSLQIPSCTFVSAVQDIFSTLLSGGMLLLIKEDSIMNFNYINKISSKYKVTHFDMVPSLYCEYLNAGVKINSLRFVLLAGEPLPTHTIQEHRKQLPDVSIVNEYGMTEVSSCFCYYKIDKTEKNAIGVPIDNMSYLISNKDANGIGELYICGPGLAIGYYNTTANKNKFVNINGIRYFKTGDFVKENIDGNLEYICRSDNQIKVNGKRIDISEIDYVLQQNKNVKKCITVVINNAIVTFVESVFDEKEYYYDFLNKRLPKQFMPNYIKVLEKFDYLPNKKIDINKMKSDFNNEKRKKKDSEECVSMVVNLLIEASDGKLYSIDNDVSLSCQGVDSLTLVRFIAELEKHFQKNFCYEDMAVIMKSSINQIEEMINKGSVFE